MRQSRTGLGVTVLACLLGGLAAPVAAMTVAALEGRVEILRDHAGEWSVLESGDTVGRLDQIRTGEDDGSRVRFMLEDGSVIVAGPRSWLRVDQVSIAPDTSRVLIRLLGGRLRVVASETFPEKGRFEVETPTAVASVHGTEFIITYDTAEATTEVIAVEGEVEVLGVLGVLGRPVVLEPRTATTVRRGAFPEDPSSIEATALAAARQPLEFRISRVDSLLAGFTGVRPVAAAAPEPATEAVCAAAGPTMRRHRARALSRDGEIIDQPIPEYAFTPPGVTPPLPPGNIRVIISGN